METTNGIIRDLWLALGAVVSSSTRTEHQSAFRHECIPARDDEQSIPERASRSVLSRRSAVRAQRKCEHEQSMETVCAASGVGMGSDEQRQNGDPCRIRNFLRSSSGTIVG